MVDFSLRKQSFQNVKIPLLWGDRAVLSHNNGNLSVIYLGGDKALPEIVSDEPWKKIEFSEKEDGFVIYQENVQAYFYSPVRKLFRDLKGTLPECELLENSTRIGSNSIGIGSISGFEVGIGVSENGFFIGGLIPAELAELKI